MEYVVKILVFRKPKYAERFQEVMNMIRPITKDIENLVTVTHDVSEPIEDIDENVTRAYVIEEAGKEDLEKLIRREGAMSPKEAIQVVKQVSTGLAAIYGIGLVHRDVKPPNIIVKYVDGKPVYMLCDFNTLDKVDEEDKVDVYTQSSFNPGTPHFKSPELNDNKDEEGNPDLPIRDIYALGIVLYQCLTGTAIDKLMNLEVGKIKDKYKNQSLELRYRNLQKDPKEFWRYLGVRKQVKNKLIREVLNNMLFYDPSKQEVWERERKSKGPDTPWHGRYQDHEELLDHIKIFDNFDMMSEIESMLDVDIGKEPEKLLGNLGNPNDEKKVWFKMNKLR